MNTVTVALLQMTACGNDQDANRSKGEAFCRRARDMGADIALFPEMWNIGYMAAQAADPDAVDVWRAPHLWDDSSNGASLSRSADTWQHQAIARDDPFVCHFRTLARELNMAIALTYLERWDGPPRNSMSLIDRSGAIVMTYAKVHTCDFSPDEAALTPGDGFHVCTLETAGGPVKIGAMICYDREFPESARLLMLKGAELILTPNACDLEINRLSQFRTRAYENMVGVALTNYAGPGLGHSVAYDGMGFDENGRSRDTLVIEAGENEGVFLARFDMEKLRTHRTRETWGNAFRKPHRYGLLTALDVAEPFIRVSAEGEAYHHARRQMGLIPDTER